MELVLNHWQIKPWILGAMVTSDDRPRSDVGRALCGLRGCKNRVCSVSRLKIGNDLPNQGVFVLLARAAFLFVFCLWCMWCFVSLSLFVLEIDCLESVVSEMTYYVSSETLNFMHSLTFW